MVPFKVTSALKNDVYFKKYVLTQGDHFLSSDVELGRACNNKPMKSEMAVVGFYLRVN